MPKKKRKQRLTFAQFQASGRLVSDLRRVLPPSDHCYEVRTPGRVYAGKLVIEDSQGCPEGKWILTIANDSRCSNRLTALERRLYQWGRDEGHI